MCGIAGYLQSSSAPLLPRSPLAAMLDALAHRGPDGRGSFQAGGAALGCVRLAVRGGQTANQPLFNETESIVAVCNGEVFNYGELAHELRAAGHALRSTSDCEVLIHLYEHHGPAGLAQVNGQFALALFDRRTRQLLLARDHFGIAPLYYAFHEGALLFGSELKALLAFPGVERRLDVAALEQFFVLPAVPSPRTWFQGLKALGAGQWLSSEGSAPARPTTYWDMDYPVLEPPVPQRSQADLDLELQETLARSVERRLAGDGEVGLWLSGGLDSALIGALAQDARPLPLRTFGLDVAAGGFSEALAQQRVVEALGLAHELTPLRLEDVAAELERVVWHAEGPLKETLDTACFRLGQRVRASGIKAVLTGQGADELFAGYVGYRFDRALLAPSQCSADEARLREWLWGDAGLAFEGHYAAKYAAWRGLLSPDLTLEACPGPLVDPAMLRGRHPLHQRSYLDLKLRLADHLLADLSDRMGYAHGVEARHPFLDLELAHLVQRLPPDYKLQGLRDKACLRRLARAYLPAFAADREKQGLAVPGSPCLLRAHPELAARYLTRERVAAVGVFDPDAVDQLQRHFLAPGFTLQPPFDEDLLISVLTFHIFAEQFCLRI